MCSSRRSPNSPHERYENSWGVGSQRPQNLSNVWSLTGISREARGFKETSLPWGKYGWFLEPYNLCLIVAVFDYVQLCFIGKIFGWVWLSSITEPNWSQSNDWSSITERLIYYAGRKASPPCIHQQKWLFRGELKGTLSHKAYSGT